MIIKVNKEGVGRRSVGRQKKVNYLIYIIPDAFVLSAILEFTRKIFAYEFVFLSLFYSHI